jgi:hypothetical protein
MAQLTDLFIFQFPFNIIIAIAVIVFIAWYILKGRDKESEFEMEDFKETVFLFHEKLIDTFGIDSNSKLIKGIEPLGEISKWFRYKGKQNIFKINKEGALVASKGDEVEVDLMIFRLGKNGWWQRLMGVEPDYIVIDVHGDGKKDMMDKKLKYNSGNNTWSLDESVSITMFGGVFIDSISAKEWVNDISFKKSQEEIMTYIQNYARKVSYIELSQAGTIERMMAKDKMKQSSYDSYKKRILSSNKDIEEDEDED